MTIVRFSNQLPMVLNRFMEEPFSTLPKKQNAYKYSSNPKANIRETEDAFTIELAVPGLTKEDISITLNQQYLIISAQANLIETMPNTEYYQKEFDYQQFSRTFIVPLSVDRERITASCQNGILTLKLPKKEEAKPKPAKQIEVI
jgi:HSP20 family protein